MPAMITSRVFVKGLPPTMNEVDFKKYFSQHGREVTDAKIFPNRRIGYVGYKTAEDAQRAVKYFNKSFIRMSRIAVELARPVDDSRNANNGRRVPTAKKEDTTYTEEPRLAGALKRKRDDKAPDYEDPKLAEFLNAMKPKSQRKDWGNIDVLPDARSGTNIGDTETEVVAEAESDDEYVSIPKKQKGLSQESKTLPRRSQDATSVVDAQAPAVQDPEVDASSSGPLSLSAEQVPEIQAPMTDADWARSRTSRLLGILDDDEEQDVKPSEAQAEAEAEAETKSKVDELRVDATRSNLPTPPAEHDTGSEQVVDADIAAVRESMRLFIRNLPYGVQKEDLESEFEEYGKLEEVHIPLDTKSGAAKGFAYVQFCSPSAAEEALIARDGQIFQGRLMHVLPAKAKRDSQLNEFELAKLPLKKQQQIKKRREAASSTFNWNALYLNADAVLSSVASRLGIAKSEALDPTSSDAAIKQAHAETHIIQETKAYFKQHGVDLESFKKSQRGDTAILIKNIPYDCSKDELRRLFEEHGDIERFLMPPSGVIAIIAFANSAQCQAAFGAMAYRKIKSSVLFLEKAPRDVFAAKPVPTTSDSTPEGVNKISASDLKNPDYNVAPTAGSATLFVRNLNFSTTTRLLVDTFEPLEGFISARVKTKTDPKKPGQVLSMGFGFLEFRNAQQAQAALLAMDGYVLEGHKLQIRASHKGADAAEERRRADAEKRANSQSTKIIVRNLPFEATKKDVRSLFGAYGQLRSVRVPKKMDSTARGFAFADFTTAKEARNAMDALRDTHLLGRRLVIEFAEADPEDAEAEIEKMQQKVGSQVNKVALQNLTSGGRRKFTTDNDIGEE